MKPTRTRTFEEMDRVISAIEGAKNLDQILEILQTQIQSMGFDRFTYWLRWPSKQEKKPVFLTTYPRDFVDYYVANDFQSHDLVGRRSISTITPFTWSSIERVMPISKIQRELFDASRSVGMVSGGSIPLHGPRQVQATLSVTNDWKTKEFDKLFEYHRHHLHIMGVYAHEKIMNLGLNSQKRSLALTKRETEILMWVSRGKTYWEIAKILHIQESTVNNHMRNIFAALDAVNGTHAISKAITHGLIVP